MMFATQVGPDRAFEIPEGVMSDLHLVEGDTVRVTLINDSADAFTSVESAHGTLIYEEGLLVWDSPGPFVEGEDRQVLEDIRRERELRLQP